jgi:glucokinase
MRGTRWVLALDVGGTNMVGALFAEDGEDPIAMDSRPTPAGRGAEAVVEAGTELLLELRTKGEALGVESRRIVGVGIGVPGAVDATRGIVFLAPNLGWRNVPIRDLFLEQLDLPVVVDNDANCAALGEWWAGAGRGSRLMVGITLGTGIGGAIVRKGRVMRGVSGAAGEAGHMTVSLGGRLCSCGNRGCLEAYASGTAIAAMSRQRLSEGTTSALSDLCGGDPERITAAMVTRAAREGDGLATGVLQEAARYLGAGLAGLVNLLNPDRIVLAGGVVQAGELLMAPVRAEVRQRAFEASAEACVIAVAREPEVAGVRGAALTFRREVLEGHR